MLYYNFNRIFKARAIDKPFAFLKRHGFSNNFASSAKRNQVLRINTKQMEKLCIIFRCTPNDLIEWKPDSENIDLVASDHPLQKLKRPDSISDISKTINSIPLEKVDEINQLINNKLKDYNAS